MVRGVRSDGWYSEPVYTVENGTLTLKEGSYVDTGEFQISFGFGDDWMNEGAEGGTQPLCEDHDSGECKAEQREFPERFRKDLH